MSEFDAIQRPPWPRGPGQGRRGRVGDRSREPEATAAPALGRVVGVTGPVVRAVGLSDPAVNEVVRVGPAGLLGEVIALEGEVATIQVYEETTGLEVGHPVVASGHPLVAWLGPGLLGAILDGLQRPLDRLAAAGHWLLRPGTGSEATTGGGRGEPVASGGPSRRGVASIPGGGPSQSLADPSGGAVATLGDRRWRFEPSRVVGEVVGPGDVLGIVREGDFEHQILVPPDHPGGRLVALEAGEFRVDEPIGRCLAAEGPRALYLAQRWPVRRPRPTGPRRPIDRPLVTGQRILDLFFPVARGGTAVIPGGFGTGKTVVEQQLARWSDADVVVYVGCGERGNEMAELLATFPELVDPRTGRPLMERTVLIANTSNMPVAAREASIQLGITIAEYFRDQGRHVALLADSTSRWAEALREIGGRLEELPGEEGYPAYLPSRLAAFYERAGAAVALGRPEREGSVTIVAAVSPPGGDFSEPVTQASLRLGATLWALDTSLAHARQFPAINPLTSYSLAVGRLARWMAQATGGPWLETRAAALELLARERTLLDIVALVGADALPERDRVVLEVARLMREVVLAQHAFDPVDAARPPDVGYALLTAVLAARTGLEGALRAGLSFERAREDPLLAELRAAKRWAGPDVVPRLQDLARRLEGLGQGRGEEAARSMAHPRGEGGREAEP